MTTISQTTAVVNVQTAPTATARNVAVDRARTFLMLTVLLHHAVIAYTYFGHTDPKSWIGFDIIVLANDSFFMAMFFFLSGLFVWRSLMHKEPQAFLRDRLLRLGLPFAIAVLTIIPAGYYAIELRQRSDASFAVFWWKTVTVGPWPSGPVWFICVLLAFDLTASLLFRFAPSVLDPVNRLTVRGYKRPAESFALMLAVTAILYIPARVYFGAGRWFEVGPLSLQASRVLLYPAYFFIGAAVGAANLDRGLVSADGRLAKSSWGWIVATLVPYCLLWVLIYIKRAILGNPVWLPNWYEMSYGLFFVTFSAAILFAVLGYFLRFKRSGFSVLDPMRTQAYGMFLVHYPIVLWIQYRLFDVDIPAIAKALTVFVLTVLFSWALTAALRTIPGATQVL
jgi:surface polysaccharide O-acyltransferase-like enzyme